MAETDLTSWLLAMEAATQIGCSKRTVERLAAAKELEQGLRRQAGSAPIAVYNPEDVARIALERRPDATPFVLGAVPAGNGNGHEHTSDVSNTHMRSVLARQTSAGDPIQQFFAVLLRILQSPPPPPPAPMAETVAETRYVTVKDAAAILGLPQADVRRLCDDGDLTHRTTGRGGIRIRRTDLEQV